MGDHFRTGKPPRRKTTQLDQLNLSHPSVGRCNEYPAKAGRKQALACFRGIAVLVGIWLRASLMEISAKVQKAVAH